MAALKSSTRLKRSDPVMAALIERVPESILDRTEVERPDDHYGALLRSITASS